MYSSKSFRCSSSSATMVSIPLQLPALRGFRLGCSSARNRATGLLVSGNYHFLAHGKVLRSVPEPGLGFFNGYGGHTSPFAVWGSRCQNGSRLRPS